MAWGGICGWVKFGGGDLVGRDELRSMIDIVLNHFWWCKTISIILCSLSLLQSTLWYCKDGIESRFFCWSFLLLWFFWGWGGNCWERCLGIVLNPYRFKTIPIILYSYPFKKLLSTLNLIIILAHLNNLSNPLTLAKILVNFQKHYKINKVIHRFFTASPESSEGDFSAPPESPAGDSGEAKKCLDA